jgi:1-phosphatidylinositol-4-phosphate 5-kinase
LELNRERVFKAGEGAGASGSFFFFSHDGRFLIKTLRGNEKDILLNMLDDFIKYLESVDNKSLIAKIYGCFTIKTNMFVPLDVIVMENTAKMMSSLSDKMSFDLKGSTFNRKQKVPNKFWDKKLDSSKVLKDQNFIAMVNELESRMLSLDCDQCMELMYILNADSKFLASRNLMDYSLLMVIESCIEDVSSKVNEEK